MKWKCYHHPLISLFSQLQQAKQFFTQHAHGPTADKYLTRLIEGCEKYWRAGRQICEETSLTGNPCVQEVFTMSTLNSFNSVLLMFSIITTKDLNQFNPKLIRTVNIPTRVRSGNFRTGKKFKCRKISE